MGYQLNKPDLRREVCALFTFLNYITTFLPHMGGSLYSRFRDN